MTLWLGFVLAAGLVVAAGVAVSRVSGELGERLGLTRAWSGAVLLALATTLPELVSSLTVTFRGAPGMAVGGILGSIVFNLFILVLIDLSDPEPIYRKLSPHHIATGLLACMLLGLLITGLSLRGGLSPGVGHVGVFTIAMLATYLLGQYVLFHLAREAPEADKKLRVSTVFNRFPLPALAGAYLGIAAVLVAAAYGLGVSGQTLASRYALGATFAGAVLLGIVTSLPEITVAMTSVRRKEFDLAVGNILGANVVALSVLAVVDIAYRPGRLLSLLPAGDALSAAAMAGLAVVMLGTALGALAVKRVPRVWRLGVASILLAAFYAAALFVSYRISSAPATGS